MPSLLQNDPLGAVMLAFAGLFCISLMLLAPGGRVWRRRAGITMGVALSGFLVVALVSAYLRAAAEPPGEADDEAPESGDEADAGPTADASTGGEAPSNMAADLGGAPDLSPDVGGAAPDGPETGSSAWLLQDLVAAAEEEDFGRALKRRNELRRRKDAPEEFEEVWSEINLARHKEVMKRLRDAKDVYKGKCDDPEVIRAAYESVRGVHPKERLHARADVVVSRLETCRRKLLGKTEWKLEQKRAETRAEFASTLERELTRGGARLQVTARDKGNTRLRIAGRDMTPEFAERLMTDGLAARLSPLHFEHVTFSDNKTANTRPIKPDPTPPPEDALAEFGLDKPLTMANSKSR